MIEVKIRDATKEALTLSKLASLGCIRSAHVGLLNKDNYTLAALLTGINLELHEFLMRASNDDYDICSFTLPNKYGGSRRIKISNDYDVWGPLARWNEVGRALIIERFNDLADVALQASGPFSFHLAATKLLYETRCPIMLCSTSLLDIGTPKSSRGAVIRQILDLLARPRNTDLSNPGGRPTAFYRVIDENGKSHYLKKLRSAQSQLGTLEYDNGFQINLEDAPANVMLSLYEMAEIESFPGFVIERRPRLVLDTAVYLTASILRAYLRDNSESNRKEPGGNTVITYHLAGCEMMRYLLFDKKRSVQYRNQVNNTYLTIMPAFGVDGHSDFRIVQGVRTLGEDQYSYRKDSFDAGKLVAGSTYRFR